MQFVDNTVGFGEVAGVGRPDGRFLLGCCQYSSS